MIFLDHTNKEYTLPGGRDIEWRISSYALVQDMEGKLLVVTPTWRSTYDLPGGGVEPSETITEGLARECYEETGYKVKVTDDSPFYISESNFYWMSKDSYCHSVNFMYRAILENTYQNTEIINTVELNEIAKVEWVDPKSLTEKNCHWMYLPAIKLLLERHV